MNQTSVAERLRWARIWLGAAALVFALALVLSWATQRRLDAALDQRDARKLDQSAKMLDKLIAHERRLLGSAIGVISEDARIRAMVLTPTFDQATVVDLLTDLKKTSGASVVAMLDGGGTVRAVVGAPQMAELSLGTSSLVREALDQPSAQLWAFADKLGVLAATPVRLDGQVRALFMMGYELRDATLTDIEQTLGVTGAAFVGETIVASASKDPEIERALRTAAELQPGTYRIVGDTFLASSSHMGETAVTARAAWLVPLQRHAGGLSLTRALPWLPAILVGLVLALMVLLVLSRASAKQSVGSGALGSPLDRQGVRRYEIEPD